MNENLTKRITRRPEDLEQPIKEVLKGLEKAKDKVYLESVLTVYETKRKNRALDQINTFIAQMKIMVEYFE